MNSGCRRKARSAQGSGKCISASTATAATASSARPVVLRRDSTVADTVTGARIRMANGLCRPPVR